MECPKPLAASLRHFYLIHFLVLFHWEVELFLEWYISTAVWNWHSFVKIDVLQQRLNGHSDIRGRILSGYETGEDFCVICLKFFCALWRYESKMMSSPLKY
jgi:hypothetical protein